jgi:hypothetical protein
MNPNQKNPVRIDTILSVAVLVVAVGFAAYGALASIVGPLAA